MGKDTEKENKPENKEIKRGKAAGRDSRGVRINNYEASTYGRQRQAQSNNQPTVLLETFRKGFFQEVTTDGSGDVVVRKRGDGRPPKYPTVESFVDKVNEYIEYINDTFNNTGVELIPDVEGFCAFAGISRDTLIEWENTRPPAYSDTIKELKTQIAAYKKQLGMQGRIPAVVLAIDFNNNHGYVQSQKIDITAQNKAAELPTAADIIKKLPQQPTSGADDLTELL